MLKYFSCRRYLAGLPFTGKFTQPGSLQKVKLPSRSASPSNDAFPHYAIHFSVSCLEAKETLTQFSTVSKQCRRLQDKQTCRMYVSSALGGVFSVKGYVRAKWIEAENVPLVFFSFFFPFLIEMRILLKPKEHFFPRNRNFFIKIHVSLMAGWLAHLTV